MKSHGVIMSDPMMRAVLSGEKIVTRRISSRWANVQTGDELWFREVWKPDFDVVGMDEGHLIAAYSYRCDGAFVPIDDTDDARALHDSLNVIDKRGWRSSMVMPRYVCRSFGTVVSVRQERLQDITEDECRLEGIHTVTWEDLVAIRGLRAIEKLMPLPRRARAHFEEGSLRDRFWLVFSLLHPSDLWEKNPMVYRIEWTKKEVHT